MKEMSLTRDKDRGSALDLAGKCHHTDTDTTSLHGIKVSAMSLPYFFGYKTETFPSKTIPKI